LVKVYLKSVVALSKDGSYNMNQEEQEGIHMEEFKVVLSNGMTLLGAGYPRNGCLKDIVVMPGMNEHATRYAPIATYLNELGYNVYVLDTFGQGLNAPRVEDLEKWPLNAFALTVEGLNVKVKELKKTGNIVALMGHSMGSFMVQSYLERYPNTVDRVVICGSNGPCAGKMKMSYAMVSLLTNKRNWDKPSHFMNNMGLGPYTKAIKDRKTDLDWLSVDEENVKRYIADPYCGHIDTWGFWHEFLKGMNTLYRKKNMKNISPDEKIMIISGEGDPVGEMGKGPKGLYKMYQDAGVKELELHIYPNMRHEILNEKNNKAVLKDLENWLR
jgi:alpha-beta hydrolase superfamily lysophospholipase